MKTPYKSGKLKVMSPPSTYNQMSLKSLRSLKSLNSEIKCSSFTLQNNKNTGLDKAEVNSTSSD